MRQSSFSKDESWHENWSFMLNIAMKNKALNIEVEPNGWVNGLIRVLRYKEFIIEQNVYFAMGTLNI